ncbi:tryptophan synthase subunit alpha, partial [Candidatus Gottesmanbacteria bacterium RIFCSPHIGHO2_02_FULL_40_13]
MRKILMTHLYFGDPSEEFSLKLAETLLIGGVDILEVGIPYTDPVCDGEVFQRACKRALSNGMTPLQVLKGINRIREKGCKNPIYLTSYFAPIYKIGLKKFVTAAKSTGVTGLIIPDLLLEEQQNLRRLTDKYSLSLIQFATVYSTKKRLKEIIQASTNFIYCVSLPGVTGDRTSYSKLL